MTELTKEEMAEKSQELKQMLDTMGVKYHHNAKIETLQKLVDEAKGPKVERVDSKAHMILHRYKVACMNPAKRDWKGEIFTVGNDAVGTVRKFIPYNCPAAEAWHIPDFLIEAIKDRKYLETTLTKDAKGRDFIEKTWKPEFVLSKLPDITEEELARLAHIQRMQQANGDVE